MTITEHLEAIKETLGVNDAVTRRVAEKLENLEKKLDRILAFIGAPDAPNGDRIGFTAIDNLVLGYSSAAANRQHAADLARDASDYARANSMASR